MFKLNNLNSTVDIIEEDLREKERDPKKAFKILDRIHNNGIKNMRSERSIVVLNRTTFSPVPSLERAFSDFKSNVEYISINL
jgi:hypothetical protein